MPKLSTHGKKRIKERVGATGKTDVKRNAKRAWRIGIKHSETSDTLHRWMDAEFLKYRTGTNMRLYNEFLYIFGRDNILITVFEVPENIKTVIEKCVSSDVYDRYISDKKNKESIKIDKKQKKYTEKKNEFYRQVYLSDIRAIIEQKGYNVYISGLHISEKGMFCLHYIPEKNNNPNMDDIRNYIKETLGFTSVRLVHVKGIDGKPVYIKE